MAMAGMSTSDESSPPPTMIEATRGPKMKPTPNSAAETFPAKWAFGRSGRSKPTLAGTTRARSVRALNTAPTPKPRNTVRARAPPVSVAFRTSAQAVPSG